MNKRAALGSNGDETMRMNYVMVAVALTVTGTGPFVAR
jgi:hypothetical protein